MFNVTVAKNETQSNILSPSVCVWMEEIPHQLLDCLSHYNLNPQWSC